MKNILYALAAISLLYLPSIAAAQQSDPKGFNQSGFIRNGIGDKCWYKQSYESTNPRFMEPALQHTTHHDVRTIQFNDPNCMANELDGANFYGPINRRMINIIITGWFTGSYVLADANYDVENLYPPGEMQARGQCIQSKTYPTRGIAIEYFLDSDSITRVTYMPALAGCGRRD